MDKFVETGKAEEEHIKVLFITIENRLRILTKYFITKDT